LKIECVLLDESAARILQVARRDEFGDRHDSGSTIVEPGHRALYGPCREFVQVFGCEPQIFKDPVDPGDRSAS
jgi:hypothetical protein